MTNGNQKDDEKQFGQLNGGLLPIITGNWGCGSSGGGDAQLKSMLQWLAASRSGAPSLVYYTAGASSVVKVLSNKLNDMNRILTVIHGFPVAGYRLPRYYGSAMDGR